VRPCPRLRARDHRNDVCHRERPDTSMSFEFHSQPSEQLLDAAEHRERLITVVATALGVVVVAAIALLMGMV